MVILAMPWLITGCRSSEDGPIQVDGGVGVTSAQAAQCAVVSCRRRNQMPQQWDEAPLGPSRFGGALVVAPIVFGLRWVLWQREVMRE